MNFQPLVQSYRTITRSFTRVWQIFLFDQATLLWGQSVMQRCQHVTAGSSRSGLILCSNCSECRY